jgi:hypothetical protein
LAFLFVEDPRACFSLAIYHRVAPMRALDEKMEDPVIRAMKQSQAEILRGRAGYGRLGADGAVLR